MHQRALAGARPSFDRNEFARSNRQVSMLQHGQLVVAHAKRFLQRRGAQDHRGRRRGVGEGNLWNGLRHRTILNYSHRNDSTGCIFAARMAGTSAPSTDDMTAMNMMIMTSFVSIVLGMVSK